jgi:hypothetical protein
MYNQSQSDRYPGIARLIRVRLEQLRGVNETLLALFALNVAHAIIAESTIEYVMMYQFYTILMNRVHRFIPSAFRNTMIEYISISMAVRLFLLFLLMHLTAV